MLMLRILSLTAIVIMLAGCEDMTGVTPANLNLALFPKERYNAWHNNGTDQDRPDSCFDLSSGVTCLLPGMRMHVEQISGQSAVNIAFLFPRSIGSYLSQRL